MNNIFRYIMVIGFLSVALPSRLFANSIDSLKTDSQVLEFLKKIKTDFTSGKYQPPELRSTETLRKDLDCDGMAEKMAINNWEKADFNGDGLTDLLVMLYWYDYGVYVIIDKGNNKYDFLTLSSNIFEKCELAKPLKIKDRPLLEPMKTRDRQLLLFYEKKATHLANKTSQVSQLDTLIYRAGDFVEMNASPANYAIDSIIFKTGYCFGSCPVFTISIDKNGNATYLAETYNPKMGTFSATISHEKLNEIVDLVNYLAVENLNNDYQVSWTDSQTSWLRIRFSDGHYKEIRDYGMIGTFGLRLIYGKFFSLRTTENWK